LIKQGFTVGSSKQPTQVAIRSSCELPLTLFFKAVAHTLLYTHQSSHGCTHGYTHSGLTFYPNYNDALYWACHVS